MEPRRCVVPSKAVLVLALLAGVMLAMPALSQDSPPATEEIELGDETVRMELLDEQTLLQDAWYPTAFFAGAGDILVQAGGRKMRSSDGGRTWAECQEAENPGVALECADGSVLWVMGATQLREDPNAEGPLPYTFRVRRADSFDALVAGEVHDELVDVSIPDLDEVYGDDGKRHTAPVDHGLVRMPNGDLIVTMYGVFKADRTPVSYFVEGFRQYRSWTCISRDDGRSWEYLSTIASVNQHPLPELAEGYCEPDLTVLEDGRLLCVMRTGGNPGDQPKRYCPLAACISEDGGATWSAPQDISPAGVLPQLVRMSNGVVVCMSGRPGFFLLLSADEGETWSEPHWIEERDGPWSRASSGYGSIGETEPGILVAAYDVFENDQKIVRVRRYRLSNPQP